MKEPALRLNKETDCYELTVTISVDAEIFKRMLYRYAEENDIDPTDLEAWRSAIETIASASRWLNHPHAVVLAGEKPVLPQVSEIAETQEEDIAQSGPFTGCRPTPEERETLRMHALDMPIDQWETLLTPLPPFPRDEGMERRARWIQHRRAHERKILEQLKQEMSKPLNMERLHAIATAVNGNGLK